ncbi:uncharacterized protein LOC132232980 [Myotis daubentonii]|uniref:uncharacterized protein LOC132232980 n=1 Tax=Myotis daubentonii TaxID=98922 RepID=UPI002873A334|nr:uncharacterized protein LOC132232980 [Myotis daubentonii]
MALGARLSLLVALDPPGPHLFSSATFPSLAASAAIAPRTREQVSAQARADRPGLPRPALHPGDSVLLKNLQPQALEPRWTEPHTVILTAPTAAKLLGDPSLTTCPGTASPDSRGPRSSMTSINVRCWAPLRSALTALPSSFSSWPSATYTHPHPLMCGGSRSVKPTTRTANKSPSRSLLAAIPLTTSPRTQGKGECQPPVAGIPLWEPETPEPILPPRMCYQTSNPVTGGQVTWNCTQNYTASSPTKASPGTFFWCNGTLSNCMNSSDPGPCFLVTVVPQLTLYGESELTGCSLHPIPGPAGLPSSLSC